MVREQPGWGEDPSDRQGWRAEGLTRMALTQAVA
jgi:hypothetical protein